MAQEAGLTANDIVITDRLRGRPGRVPDYAAESRALEALAEELAERPENLLQRLAETLVDLGIADSAGVSIEEIAEARQFRWVALAGVWGQFRGGTIAFDASPCGVVVERDTMLLFESPERFFPAAMAEPLIHEGLLVPFHSEGRPVGTLWVNAHTPDRKFDREDARLLQVLARFASAGYQMTRALRSAEAGRSESDTRLRALAHASSDAFYVMSADMRELRELSGGEFIPDATRPSRDWLRDYIPAEDHARTLAAIREAIQTKGVFELEHRVRRVDGEVGWALSRAVPILGTDGEIVEWFGAASDITERKRAEIARRESEERQAFLLKLSDALQSLDDAVAIQTVAARVLGEHLAASRVAYVEFTGDEYVIRQDYVDGIPSMVGRHAVASFGSGKVADYHAGATRVVRDTSADVHNAPSDTANFAAFHVRAGVGVPLVKNGQFVASLVVHMNVPRNWTPDEVALVEETAERTWQAVERARSEAALRASEARLAAAIASVPVGLAVIDINGEIVTGNEEYRRFLPRGVVPSRDPAVTGKWRAWNAEGLPVQPKDFPGARAMRGERVVPGQEMLYTADDGREVWTSVASVPIRDAGGHITGQASVVSDIDDAKRTADALRASEARYQALFAASPVPFMVLAANPPDYTITAANEAYFATTLTTPETLIGRRLFDVFPDDPLRPGQLGSEALAISLEKVLTTRRTNAMERVRYDLVTPEGFEPHWWLATNAPLLDADGNVTAIIHQVDRQTELHHAEEAERQSKERQAFLLKLSDTLRPLADAVDIMKEASEALGRHLDVGRCAYCEVDETGDYFTVERDWTDGVMHSYVGRHFFGFGDQFREEYRAGKSVVIDDALADARAAGGEAAFEAAGGARASIGIPLIKEGRFAAGFFVQQREPRHWTAQEEEVTREVAERTWAALERARAEGRLRKSEERLRQFGEASQDILWIRDATTLRWTYLTPAFRTIYGVTRDEALAGDDYRKWQDLIVPEDRALAVAAISRVLAGEQVTFEYRVRRPSDGAIRWLRNTDFPIFDDIGRIVSIGGVGHDMTDMKAIQVEVAESEERLRTLMEGIPQLVWRSCAEGRWTWASPQWLAFTGQSQEESRGLGWLDVVHPDDHAATMRAWENAKPHGLLDVENRVRRAADGAWLWHNTRSVPVRDADGTIVEWLGTTTDVHALRELQERQGVLVAELQHRTRNLITVIRSLSDRTVGNAASLDDFKGRFGRRLAALSRVQGLLSHLSAGERVAFDGLLRSELTALGVGDGKAERVTLDGPSDVPLRSATVQTLALAIHELATNAVKYGALSEDAHDAHLTVRWHVAPAIADAPPLLHVEWRESGVAMPQAGAPARGSGYGRELIERALPYQLGADTTYELGDDGVRCTITMPISR